jgi:hypothetical protein
MVIEWIIYSNEMAFKDKELIAEIRSVTAVDTGDLTKRSRPELISMKLIND